MADNNFNILEREIWIAARPETIFEFFTDPQKMVQWKGISATLEPQPNGIYRVNVNGRDIVRGQYVEVKPPHRLVFTWGWEGEGSVLKPGASTVEISLRVEARARAFTLNTPACPRQNNTNSMGKVGTITLPVCKRWPRAAPLAQTPK